MTRVPNQPRGRRKAKAPVRGAQLERRYARAGIGALILIFVASYAAFVKELPFSSSFVMRGVFRSSNELQPGNPVRIAGLQIGTVSHVSAAPGNESLVTMKITKPGELHTNASLSIEPRLLFEGNFYVKVDPGTPGSPQMRSGTTVPASRTTVPVQIDQVLDVLDTPTRASLKSMTASLASALGSGGADAHEAGAGAAGLDDAIKQLGAALPSTTLIAHAAQGTRPGDLPAAIDGARDLANRLSADPAALADLITSEERTVAAPGSNEQGLTADVSTLDHLTRTAPAAFTAINGALPAVDRFSVALRPALHAAPGALSATSALLGQVKALTGSPELPRLLPALNTVTGKLPGLETRLDRLLPQLTAISTCANHTVLPGLDTVITDDGANNTGQPAWQELLHMTAGLAGASEGFDGDGSAIRLGVAEGSTALTAVVPGLGTIAGSFQGEGVRPTWLGYGVVPAFRPDQRCASQAPPNVNLPGNSAGSPMTSASRRGTGVSPAIVKDLVGSASQRAAAINALLGASGSVTHTAPRSGSSRPSAPKRTALPTTSAPAAPASPGTASTPAAGTPAPAPVNPVSSIGSSLAQTLQSVGSLLGGHEGPR